MITTSQHRAEFEAARFTVIMWSRRVENAERTGTDTRQSLVRAELKLAAMLEDAHTDALAIDAEIMSTIATAAHEADTDTLLTILAEGTADALVLTIIATELQARSDAEVATEYRAEDDAAGHALAVAYATEHTSGTIAHTTSTDENIWCDACDDWANLHTTTAPIRALQDEAAAWAWATELQHR